MLLAFVEGDVEGGRFEPRHWDVCDVRLAVVVVDVIVLDDFKLVSLLFCNAILRRFERFGFEANCVEAPKFDMDTAVERDPCALLATGIQ